MQKIDKRLYDHMRAQLIIAAVSLEFGTPHFDLNAKTRGANDVCLARQLSMYLMNIIFGVSLTRIGHVFNRDRSTASHACNVIEDYREDPLLDEKIVRLETFLNGSRLLTEPQF